MKGRVRWPEQRLDAFRAKRLKRRLKLVGAANLHWHKQNAGRLGGDFSLAQLRYVQLVGDIDEQADARQAWQHFTKQVDLLGRKYFREVCKASHVAARMGEAGHKSEAHGVRATRHDDGARACWFSGGEVGWKRRGDDHARTEVYQLGCQSWQALQITTGEAKLKTDVATLDISEPPHALSKTCQIALQRLRGSRAQKTD